MLLAQHAHPVFGACQNAARAFQPGLVYIISQNGEILEIAAKYPAG